MSGGTLLFSTDLRTGYADPAALAAAIAAGTHPIFANTSGPEAGFSTKMAFDDVVTYLGAGTVKVMANIWLDHLPGHAVTDCWLRSILRLSPTINNVSQLLGRLGFIPHIYDDNVDYFDYVQWALKADVLPTAIVGHGLVSRNYGEEDNNAEGGTLDLADLQDGAFRDFTVHIVRGATAYVFEIWIDRVLFARYSIPIMVGFAAALANIESSFSPIVGQGDGPGDAGDYLNVALLEAYAGGDPYDLLIRKPGSLARTARNATQCAPEDASLWTGLKLALPLVEGAGEPLDLVSGLTLPITGGVTWTTVDGLAALHFDGTGYLTLPAPLLTGTRAPCALMVVRFAVPVDPGLYPTVYQEESEEDYAVFGVAGPTTSEGHPQNIGFDVWQNTPGREIAWQAGGVLSPGVHLLVCGRDGSVPLLRIDGSIPSDPPYYDPDETADPDPSTYTQAHVSRPAYPFIGDLLGLFLLDRNPTEAEIARWNTQPFGLATRAWRKPAPWAYDPAKSAAPTDAADLGLLLAAWERSGEPKNLVTGDTLTRSGGVAWAEREGCPVLRFDGATGYIVVPAPVIGEATDYTMLMVLKNSDTVGTVDQLVYEEDGADGQIHDYTQAGYIRGTAAATGVFSDHWNNTTEEELYNATHGEVKDLDFSGLRVIVVCRTGRNLTIWVDGEQMADQPPSYLTDGTVSIVSVLATIGATHHTVGPDEFIHFLNADLALLAIAPGVAWSDERIVTRSADPMALLRRDYAKPLSTVGWTPATSLVPAVAAKAKILLPFTEGSGNPKELVSGETLTLEDGDEWATANGLLGITLVDYTDGSPGTDLIGRLLDAYGPAFQMNEAVVLWGLVSLPVDSADRINCALNLFTWNTMGAGLYFGTWTGTDNFGGVFRVDGGNAVWASILSGLPPRPGGLYSLVLVCRPGAPGTVDIFLNEVSQPVDNQSSGTVGAGALTTQHETPFNLGFGQYQNHAFTTNVAVPGHDRFVIHGAGIFEGMTAPEIAAFVADPMEVMRQVEAGGGGTSGVRRRRRRVLLAQR